MNKIFKNKIRFLITEIDLNENNILLKEELKNKEIELNQLSNAKYNNGKKNNIKNEIDFIKKKIIYNNERRFV